MKYRVQPLPRLQCYYIKTIKQCFTINIITVNNEIIECK